MPKTMIVPNISDVTWEKLRKLKDEQGFPDENWLPWLEFLARQARLSDTPSEAIQRGTRETLLDLWCTNFARNLPYIIMDDAKTMLDLVAQPVAAQDDFQSKPIKPEGSAIVVGAGPSITRHKHLELLAESGYNGLIIATDRMLVPCLKLGIIPDLTITVDGAEIIKKWYDDPIVSKYGGEILVLMCSEAHPTVIETIMKAGCRIYWFNPIFDDWRQNESWTKINKLLTKTPKRPLGVPGLACLGNAGACSWVVAWRIMLRSPVCLIGLDYGYEAKTPLEETSYFKPIFLRAQGDMEKVSAMYETIHNPYWDLDAMADPVFKYYKVAFLEALETVPPWVETIQSTEGGILYTDNPLHNMKPMTFKEFLTKYPK